MKTMLASLNPPPVRPGRVVNYNSWHKEGSRICRVSSKSNNYHSGFTPDDLQEGGGDCYRRLFLESPKVEEGTQPEEVSNGSKPPPKEKKRYTVKNKPPISTGGINGRGFGPRH